MSEPSLFLPQLAPLYAALTPWAAALLRAAVGLALVPHALRFLFGWFPDSGARARSVAALAGALDRNGYRPGRLWAAAIILTEIVGGPLLALGLFTRPVCLPIVILLVLSVVAHWRDGWFWNTLGIEYPLLWAACALYFLVNGGGAISLDRMIGWEF
jgi:putative oxidoreductase